MMATAVRMLSILRPFRKISRTGLNAGDCHHPSGSTLLCAIRKEQARVAAGTEFGSADMVSEHSRGQQLPAIRFHQVEKNLCRQIAVARSTSRHEQQGILLPDLVGLFGLTK